MRVYVVEKLHTCAAGKTHEEETSDVAARCNKLAKAARRRKPSRA
jgi:hypothetical protein